jgi:2-desacetyl-2-hydroxyethyl bacteriochlorophyllide A dehydrogenase
MKAAVWRGLDRLEIEEVPTPTPGPPDVLVRVAACGVCGTDVHILEGKYPVLTPPRIIGHEYVGTVSAVGSGVAKVKVGDRIAIEVGICCGRCHFCRSGRENLCANRLLHLDGFAEFACVPDRLVHRLPEGLPFEIAALAEPAACGLRAMDLTGVRSGGIALILGGGTIGLILTQLLLHGGIAKVIVSEPLAHRRAAAKAVGALPVDPTADGLDATVLAETDGLGPEYAFDCVGHPALLQQCVDLVQPGGSVIEVGVADPTAVAFLRPYQLFAKELTITATYSRPYTFTRALRWLPHLTLGPLLGVEFPLAETKIAVCSLREGKGIKILVKP